MKVTISVVYDGLHIASKHQRKAKAEQATVRERRRRTANNAHVKEIFITSHTQAAAEDAVPQADLNPTANPSPVMQPHPSHRADID